MGDLSENFSRWEFECPDDCGFSTIDYLTLQILQADIREYYNKRVTISRGGGARCWAYNSRISNSANFSQHLFAKAVDFNVDGVKPRAVFHYLHAKFPDRFGIGLYRGHVHFDARDEKARWSNDPSIPLPLHI